MCFKHRLKHQFRCLNSELFPQQCAIKSNIRAPFRTHYLPQTHYVKTRPVSRPWPVVPVRTARLLRSRREQLRDPAHLPQTSLLLQLQTE